MKLIVVDIPRVTTADEQMRASIPEALYSDFEQNSDMLVHSREILASFDGALTTLHLLHGLYQKPPHAVIAGAVVDALNSTR